MMKVVNGFKMIKIQILLKRVKLRRNTVCTKISQTLYNLNLSQPSNMNPKSQNCFVFSIFKDSYWVLFLIIYFNIFSIWIMYVLVNLLCILNWPNEVSKCKSTDFCLKLDNINPSFSFWNQIWFLYVMLKINSLLKLLLPNSYTTVIQLLHRWRTDWLSLNESKLSFQYIF